MIMIFQEKTRSDQMMFKLSSRSYLHLSKWQTFSLSEHSAVVWQALVFPSRSKFRPKRSLLLTPSSSSDLCSHSVSWAEPHRWPPEPLPNFRQTPHSTRITLSLHGSPAAWQMGAWSQPIMCQPIFPHCDWFKSKPMETYNSLNTVRKFGPMNYTVEAI